MKAKVTHLKELYEVELGETLVDVIEYLGSERMVLILIARGAVISLRNRIKFLFEKGKTPDEIRVEIAEWKPEESRAMDPVDRAVRDFEKLTDEEKRLALARYRQNG